ncbi:MAG: hypothetical protein HQ503_17280 [Rhodospirillales bacterium]|nr:hypothetical protein [Rhodospirillales bacterium]
MRFEREFTVLTKNKLPFFIILWLSLDFIILGKFAFISMGDNADIVLSGLIANKKLGDSVQFWNMFSTGGVDRIAQGYYGALDVWLFKYLPGWFAYQLRAVSQIIAAVLGTYFLCRRNLGFSPLASAVSGFLYAQVAFSGQLIQSVMLYLPVSILALSLVLENPAKIIRWAFLIFIGLVISLTAYLSRLAPFLAFVHFLWFAFVERKQNPRDWGIIILFSIAVVGLRFPDYMAAIANGLISDRHEAQIFSNYSPINVLQNLVPSFYNPVRVIATACLVLALIFCWKNVRNFNRIAAALIVGIGLALIATMLRPVFTPYLPLLGSFDLGRMIEYLWIFMAMGAGGFVHWLETAKKRNGELQSDSKLLFKKAPVLIIILIFAASLNAKYKTAKDWISQGSYVNVFESPVYMDLAGRMRKIGLPNRVATFQIYPNILHAYGIETVGGYQALQLKRYKEFWNKVIAPSQSNHRGDRFMLNPAIFKPDWDFSAEYNVKLLSLANMKFVVSRDRLSSPNLIPIRELDKPWHSLTTFEKVKKNAVNNFTGHDDLYVYENANAFPRFFFGKSIKSFASSDQTLDAMAKATLKDLRESVYLEKSYLTDDFSGKTTLGGGRIELLKYSADEISLRIELQGDGFLVATNGFSPFWTVSIDGKPGKIVPAYHTFWGVFLPKSTKTIVFKYVVPWRLGYGN